MLIARAVFVGLIAVKLAGQRLSALVEAFLQIAPDNAEPVGVGEQLVFTIDRRDGVLAVGNRRKRGFDIDVRDARLVGFADGVLTVEHHFDVKAVVFE